MQLDDSSCDNPWLSPSCLADLTRPLPNLVPCASVLACSSFCLSVCMWLRLDFEGLENGEDGFLDKTKSWSRSIEDLHHTNNQPFCNTLVRSARQSVLRYVWLSQLPCCYPCYCLALLTLNAINMYWHVSQLSCCCFNSGYDLNC